MPEIPADLTTLSDDELAALLDELRAYFNTASENVANDDQLAELRTVTEAVENVKAEQTKRSDAAAERTAELDALRERVGTDEAEATEDDSAADEGDPDEGEQATAEDTSTEDDEGETPEQIAAGAQAPPPPAPARSPAKPKPAVPQLGAGTQHQAAATKPVVPARPAVTITAGADVPGMSAGQEMPDLAAVATAMVKRREGIRHVPEGVSEQVLVASIHSNLPEDRQLHAARDQENWNKIENVTSPQALVASGGLCAPVQPYYDILTLAEAMRPVRDALPSFSADRGGIRFLPPPDSFAADAAVGYITAAVDAAALGGDSGEIAAATKPCLHVPCPDPVEYAIYAVTHCLEFGNFTARAYPEQVTAWLKLALASWARVAETKLLDGISSASTQITAGKTVGMTRQLVAQMVQGAAYFRNRNRMNPTTRLRMLYPAWVLDAMVSDVVQGSGYDEAFLTAVRSSVEGALDEVNVTASWYVDTPTGKGQLINGGVKKTNGAAIGTYPSTAVWYLFAEGSFLFLDGGSLDFGLIRDSALNALNNYRIFAETFENVAYLGVESLEVVSTVVADGTYSPAGTAPSTF